VDTDVALFGLVWYVVFLFSTTLHEASHALVAKWGGDLTAYQAGQVSLDPRPHIRREPFGMVVLPILSALMSGWPIGFASAPYDPYWAQRHPRRAAWMAAAGPVSNLLLVAVAAGLVWIGIATGGFAVPEQVSAESVVSAVGSGVWPAAAFLVSAFFTLNLLLFAFNLLPLPPLDGSGVLPLFLPDSLVEGYQRLMRQPLFAIGGLLLAWQAFGAIFGPLFRLALGLLYPGSRWG
jgi:Zn-dependent protease